MAKSFNAQMQDRFIKITTDYNTVNQYVHDTAVMIAKHAQEHNDCSTAQGLVMAMPASIRREMLILWFAKFTPIIVKNDDKWTAKMHPKDSKNYVPFDLEAGEKTTFMSLSRQNKEKAPLDYAGLVMLPAKIAKQLEDRLAEGKIDEGEVETAKALINQLRGIRVVHVEPTPAPAPEAPTPVENPAEAMGAAAAA